MTYSEALSYLHGAGRFSSRATLERIKSLMSRLGDPQKNLRFIHVAGTNGKGSTCAMLDSILRAAGYRTGLFTSPYLTDFCERIRLNGNDISRGELVKCVQAVRDAAQGDENEFELVTAAALVYYSRSICDIVVWETGLGGRLDATNVIDPPDCAVITSISFDHMAQLGDTIAQIASEKCGIIKPGTGGVVASEQENEAMEVIERACANAGVNLLKTKPDPDLRLPLKGAHQRQNAAAAAGAVEVLRSRGFVVSEEDLRRGLETVSWPGRLELVSEAPPVILDAAHNRSGFDALIESMGELFPGKSVTAVCGMLADKEYEYCIKALAKICRRFVAVAPPSPRALEPGKAAGIASAYCEAAAGGELKTAIETEVRNLPPDSVLLICGSIYLIGDARRYFPTQ
ncbi:MAG: bifunctional folylpolyglutamate synthase/dihydrofolate synthase [Oscillospiraceae bacterium]|jgi:dihydrofolate synthase/folylpolyglutamate synthase